MAADSRFEIMRTSYGRAVEVGRLCFFAPGTRNERVILDVPRQNPEYDALWVALSPDEARSLAGLLLRHAAAADSWGSAVGNGDGGSGHGGGASGNGGSLPDDEVQAPL
ncbi:MAG: hypothetical protein ACODAF_01640 [Actinomycetota bacterium]